MLPGEYKVWWRRHKFLSSVSVRGPKQALLLEGDGDVRFPPLAPRPGACCWLCGYLPMALGNFVFLSCLNSWNNLQLISSISLSKLKSSCNSTTGRTHVSTPSAPVQICSPLFTIPVINSIHCELPSWWEPKSVDRELPEVGLHVPWKGSGFLPCLPAEPDSSRYLACVPEALQEETLQWPSICLAHPGKVWSQGKRTGRQSVVWRAFYIK